MVAVSSLPLRWFVTVTFAPATAAPCGSVTVPKMLPYTACANAAVGISMHKDTNDTASTIQNFVFIELLRVDPLNATLPDWLS